MVPRISLLNVDRWALAGCLQLKAAKEKIVTHASIVIRPMREDEKQTVHGVMRQSFPLIQRWFFSWTPNVLFAERDGQVLGGLTVLTLSWMLWLVPRFVNWPPEIVSWLVFAGFIGKPLALFDIALPFFPFVSYSGGRLWDWNRVVWGVLALAAVALFLV